MGYPGPRHQQGFNRGEMLLALTIIGLLAGVLLHRLQDLEERTEPVLVNTLLATLNGYGAVRFARAYAVDQRDDLLQWEGRNPMDWVETPPANYGGEVDLGDDDEQRLKRWQELAPAHWYFDRRRGELLYKVSSPEQIEKALPPFDQLRFRIRLQRNSGDDSGIKAMLVEALDEYRWVAL